LWTHAIQFPEIGSLGLKLNKGLDTKSFNTEIESFLGIKG